jgi:hypothetical protein
MKEPIMNILDQGVIFASKPGTRYSSCAFPGVCVLPSGRWLCGFRAAPIKTGMLQQTTMVTWSDDQGKIWSSPIEPFTPPVIDGRPGLFRVGYQTSLGGSEVLATLYWVDHSNPSLPFFNEITQGLLDSKIFLSLSYDDGEHWSIPWRVDTTPFHQPTPITGPTLVLPDGRWVCQFELNKPYYDETEWRHSSVMIFSNDHGKTWPEHTIASNDPANRIFYWDQRPAILDDGRVLDLFWTYDNQSAIYLNIHARESLDGGTTWSPMWDTNVPGQPAPPVSLADGRIVMVYVDRTSTPVIKARTSSDGGRSWPESTEIRISQPPAISQTKSKGTMQDAWSEMSKFSIGLPATAKLNDREVLVVYYSGPQTDETSILWAKISY